MLPLNFAEIPKLYKQALALQAKHKNEDALKIYASLLNINPKIAEVHYQVGTIFLDAAQYDKAEKHLNVASLLKPNELAIWYKYSDSLLFLADKIKIKNALKRIQKCKINNNIRKKICKKLKGQTPQPRLAHALQAEVHTLRQRLLSKNFAKAETIARILFAKYPTEIIIGDLLGLSLFHQNKIDQAREVYHKVLKIDSDFTPSLSNLGLLELDQGRIDTAIPLLNKAIMLDAQSSTALINLVHCYLKKKHFTRANILIEKHQTAFPKRAEINWVKGMVQARLKKHKAAIKNYHLALKKGLKNICIYLDIALSYTALRDFVAAEKNYDIAIKINPNFAEAYFQKSRLKQTEGAFEQARTLMHKALKIDSQRGDYFLTYVTAQKIKADDPIIQTMLERFNHASICKNLRMYLCFALTKAFEDTKKYDVVFNYLKLGNQLACAQYPYNIDARQQQIAAIKANYATFNFDDYQGFGNLDSTPIFICGLPRSGTTLVEQIITQHSLVSGGDEIGAAGIAEVKIFGDKSGKPRDFVTYTPSEFTAYADEVLANFKPLYPNAPRITDKSVSSYLRMALIKIALPNAKIIVVRRDPRDNLLSIYRNKFLNDTHRYAYDLRTLGLYYNLFVELIDFWHQKLPNQFYEIQYEALIKNPQFEIRKLLDFCALEWQEACLSPQDSKRSVKTLSVYQVRQPIYQSSVKAWQRYEKHLMPMFDALKEGGNYPV